MPGRILYKSSVSRDLKKISPKDGTRILNQIGTTLSESPRGGEALHGEFQGLFKLRVGDYRVVYAIFGPDILVLRIRHRGKAYD
ncbi:MAG: type II toxin-antitoxin system RelE/ParE family toxin [archaeon]|nr:MAG: type II toxin-antitoxin system RelE/ParE family toxin [archaeon]